MLWSFNSSISKFLNQMFSISDEGIDEAIDPPMSAAGMHRQTLQITPNQQNEKQQTQNGLVASGQKEATNDEALPSGCTRFCKLNFYRPYFNVNQNEVITRLKQSVTFPPSQDFFTRAKLNPDFYGPFWIITTLVLLLGSVDNISNYMLSLFNRGQRWTGYFFKLEYLRYAITVLYSYFLLVSGAFYLYYKFMAGKTNISFPQIICLYGYAFSCYLPAIAVCIIPLETIHWIAVLYASANSALFLYANLRNQIEGIQVLALAGVIGGIQLVLSLILKLYFLTLIKT